MANGQSRADYPLLSSVLTTETTLEAVVSDLMQWYAFPILYIADLDAIEGIGHHQVQLENLSQAYPKLEIWLDPGIKTIEDCEPFRTLNNIHLVLGTETLAEVSVFQDPKLRARSILSLDIKDQQWLGESGVAASPGLWPDRVIVMSLDHVGKKQGPAIELLTSLKQKVSDKQWFMAGGVRNEQDLSEIAQNEAQGALIATALHRGHVNREAIKRYMGKK